MPKVPALKWGNGRLDQFRLWIQHELNQTIADRVPLETKWREQLVQWRAALPKTTKDFPFVGASNIEFPLTAMHSDPVYADFMESLHAPEDYWGVAPKRPDRTEHANPLREFMTATERNFLKMRDVNRAALLDLVVHGTAIYKNNWHHERKSVVDRDPVTFELKKTVRITSNPLIERVPLQYFYIPANAWEIDADAPIGGAQWVAQKFYVTKAQLRQRAKSDGSFLPDYDAKAVETVERFLTTNPDGTDKAIREQESYEPWSDLKIELFEVHARYDVDDDGSEEDIVCVLHRESGIVLRATLQPFLHGRRPFHKCVYLPTFGFYGQGIAELDEWSQVTLTKLMNGMLDNMLIVNTAMFAAPFGSSLKPGEPVYPGRVINYQPGENPPTRIPLGELNQSWPQIQNFIMQVADNRTGISDIRRGNANSLPGRTPATTVMNLMQESGKRFGMVMSGVRAVHSEIGLRMLQNIAQFYQDDPTRWRTFCADALGEKDAEKVLEVLMGPIAEIEAAFGVSITATSQMVNKEAEKQSFIGLLQLAGQIYGQAVQTMMMAEQMPPGSASKVTAEQSYIAMTELLKRLLERFDIQNPDQYVGNMTTISTALAAQQTQQNAATMGMAPPVPVAPYPGGNAVDPYIAQLLGVA